MTYSKLVSGDQSRNFVYENIQLAVDTQLVGKRQNLVKQFEQEKEVSENTITLKYDPTHEVDRVLNGKKKDFYPKYLNEGKWETGLGDRKTWKPYGCETILNFHGEFPLWHEGEKATAYAINKGLPSISVVGSGAEDETIIRNAIRILQAMESGGAIYIIDNDEAAIRKARAIQKIAKKEDFLVLALPIKAIFPKAEKGDDIVEYLKANPNHTTTDIKNDIEVVIEEYFDSLIKDYENCDKEAEKPINQGKVVKFPRQIDTKTALEKVQQLAGLEGSQLQEEILKISNDCGVPTYELEKYHQSLLRENESQESLGESKEWLNNILAIEKSTLNLAEVLPPELTHQINNLADGMKSTPEHLFTALLPTWGAGIGSKSKIVISPSIGYTQPAVIRTMLLANSGDRKSPILKNAIAGISNIESENRKQYQQELLKYQEELALWKADKSKDKGSPPPEPVEKRIIVKNVNIDGLIRIHSENPDGLLAVNDELTGYFARQNKQTGKGDDAEQDLELFNGDSLTKDRMGKEFSFYVPNSHVSIVGGIQWKILRKLIQKVGEDDGAGTIARWLICAKEMPPAYLDIIKDNSKLFNEFKYTQQSIFQQLRDLPQTDYLLDDKAKVLWQDFQHELENMRQAETIEALRIYYPKAESYFSRIALVLHCLEQVMNNTHSTTISADIVGKAIKIMLYYLGQYKMVVAKVNPATDSLSGELLRIRDLLKRHKQLTPRIVKQFDRQLAKTKNSNELIKEYFSTLVKSGIAEYIPAKTLKIGLLSPSADKVQTNCLHLGNSPKNNENNGFKSKEKTSVDKCRQASTPLETNDDSSFDSKCRQNDKTNFSFRQNQPTQIDKHPKIEEKENSTSSGLSAVDSETIDNQASQNCRQRLHLSADSEKRRQQNPISSDTSGTVSESVDNSADSVYTCEIDKQIKQLASIRKCPDDVITGLANENLLDCENWYELSDEKKQHLVKVLKAMIL